MPGFELLHVRPWNSGGRTRAFAVVKLERSLSAALLAAFEAALADAS